MNNNEDMLNAEISFMYKKYEELCQAYKKLSIETKKDIKLSVTDQSKMDFTDSV